MLVKDAICKYVKVINGLSTDVLWFKVRKPYFENDVLFGAVYVAPENSRFCSIECFDIIEDDLARFISEQTDLPFCLLGDFNARSANLNDLFSTR